MKVLAGIVLYNPDVRRLKENYDAIYSQVDKVLFVDNNSSNRIEIEESVKGDYEYLRNSHNMGIAAALNQVFRYAIKNNYDAVITLDQDSVTTQEIVKRYKQIYKRDNQALITCMIHDRNFGHDRLDDKQKQYIEKVKYCITSACFCPVSVYEKVGSFDEQMFIDYVDFDYCIRARKQGFKIYRIKYIGLIHEVGRGKKVKLFWRDFVAFNHSVMRNYYMARNDVYLYRKHRSDYNSLFRLVIRQLVGIYIVVFYEHNKKEKIVSRLKGIRDAFRLKL